jgi:hypothetical protein
VSLSQAVVCDGCGCAEQAIRPDKGHKHIVPVGWLRLSVIARKSSYMEKIAEVEVHCLECATIALAKFFEDDHDLSEPVEPKDPPPDVPGSGSLDL